jgi:hypothetical protein
MPEHRNVCEFAAVEKNLFVCENFVDAVKPFLRVAAAAFQD